MDGTMATIMLFAGNFAPKHSAYCNGQILSINTNQALFSLLGTTYGGDGRTTFALPNFQGRTNVGAGQSAGGPNFSLGQAGGQQSVTLNISHLPNHNHNTVATLTATSAAPNADEGDGSILAGANIYAGGAANGSLGGVTEQATGITGQSQPVNIEQPFLGMNFVICVQGVFPSRS